MLEGVGEGQADFVERASDSRPPAKRIIATGNAVTKNRLREILAGRFGLPVLIPSRCEEAAYGAALLAGSHAALWPSLDQARASIHLSEGTTAETPS